MPRVNRQDCRFGRCLKGNGRSPSNMDVASLSAWGRHFFKPRRLPGSLRITPHIFHHDSYNEIVLSDIVKPLLSIKLG